MSWQNSLCMEFAIRLRNCEEEADLLRDEIIHVLETETAIEQKVFENERVSGMNAEKIMYGHVRFIKCQLPENDFDGGEFVDAEFDGCDLSNCHFKNAYFRNCKFRNCKMDGCSFGSALFKGIRIENCSCRYCNFVSTLWENTIATDSNMEQSFFSEVTLKKPVFHNINFTSADFFKTKLRGIDLSDCIISNLMVSDTYAELAGVKVNIYQAAELAKLLKVQIV